MPHPTGSSAQLAMHTACQLVQRSQPPIDTLPAPQVSVETCLPPPGSLA